jgi:hypothetical protein
MPHLLSQPQEGNPHPFQCLNLSRKQWHAAMMSTLQKQLETNQANPILVDMMMAGLGSYFLDKHIS